MHIAGYPFDPDAVYRKQENIDFLESRKKQIIAEGRQQRYIDRIGEWYLKSFATENVDMPDNVYFDGAQTDVAVQKIAELQQKNKPFFFAIGYYRPHLPFNVPKRFWDMYDTSAIQLADNAFHPKNVPEVAIHTFGELRNYHDIPVQGPISEETARNLIHGYYASTTFTDYQIGRLLGSLEKLLF